MQTPQIAVCALAICASAACLPPDAPASSPEDSSVVVGRLITREGVVDLTVHAFADSQGPVPTGSYARLMADVAKDSVQDARNTAPRPNTARVDQDDQNDNFLRRSF